MGGVLLHCVCERVLCVWSIAGPRERNGLFWRFFFVEAEKRHLDNYREFRPKNLKFKSHQKEKERP